MTGITKLDDTVSVAGQIAPEEMRALAGQGFRSIIGNRPDGEEPGQPDWAELEAAAREAGLETRHIPIASPEDLEARKGDDELAGVFAVAMLALHSQDPRGWNVAGNESGEAYFFPGLSRTVSGDFIPAHVLSNDQYCLECHADIHADWANSMHRFSSFNNPPYEAKKRTAHRVAFRVQKGDCDIKAGGENRSVSTLGKFDFPKESKLCKRTDPQLQDAAA